MARTITCDRCGKPTAEDFSMKEVEIPEGFERATKPAKVTISIVTASNGYGDLCRECAVFAAEVLASTFRSL